METFNPLGSPLVNPDVPEARTVPSEGTEFERFADLTRKVIQVPKRELSDKPPQTA